MQVLNAVMPTQAQLQALLAAAPEGPIVMVNLLKFKAKAAYDKPGEPEMSGQEAYMRYGAEMIGLVQKGGGRMLFNGAARAMVIGEVGEMWDSVALVEYPSAAAFIALATSAPVAALAHHRKAGLEGQLLIATQAQA